MSLLARLSKHWTQYITQLLLVYVHQGASVCKTRSHLIPGSNCQCGSCRLLFKKIFSRFRLDLFFFILPIFQNCSFFLQSLNFYSVKFHVWLGCLSIGWKTCSKFCAVSIFRSAGSQHGHTHIYCTNISSNGRANVNLLPMFAQRHKQVFIAFLQHILFCCLVFIFRHFLSPYIQMNSVKLVTLRLMPRI